MSVITEYLDRPASCAPKELQLYYWPAAYSVRKARASGFSEGKSSIRSNPYE